MDRVDPSRQTWAAWWLSSYAHQTLEGHLWADTPPTRDAGLTAAVPCGAAALFLVFPDASGLLLRGLAGPYATRQGATPPFEIFPHIFDVHPDGEAFVTPPVNIGWLHAGMAKARAAIDAALAAPGPFPPLAALPAPWTIVPHPQRDAARLGFLRAWVSLWSFQSDIDAVHPFPDLRRITSLAVHDDGVQPLTVQKTMPACPVSGFLLAQLESAMERFAVPRGALYQDVWMFTNRHDRPGIFAKGIERHGLRVEVPPLSAHQALVFLDTGVLPESVGV